MERIVKQTHIGSVYVCFLPSQKSQWVHIDDEIDSAVDDYYREKLRTLDILINGRRVIGISVGNPKQYTREDIYILHQKIEEILNAGKVDNVNISLFEKYFSEEDMTALCWTIAPYANIDGYSFDRSIFIDKISKNNNDHFNQLNAHDRYQLLPLTYPDQADIEVYESISEHTNKVVICLNEAYLKPLLIAAQEDTTIVNVNYYDASKDFSWISRPGIKVQYQQTSEGLIFDLLHYGLQYKVAPIILKKSETIIPQIKIFGSHTLDLSEYLVQTPQYKLFDSKISHRQIVEKGEVHITGYEDYRNYYLKDFSIMEMSIELPLYYQVQLMKKILY